MLRNLENVLEINYSGFLCPHKPKGQMTRPTSHNELMVELVLTFVTSFHGSVLKKRGLYFGDNLGAIMNLFRDLGIILKVSKMHADISSYADSILLFLPV